MLCWTNEVKSCNVWFFFPLSSEIFFSAWKVAEFVENEQTWTIIIIIMIKILERLGTANIFIIITLTVCVCVSSFSRETNEETGSCVQDLWPHIKTISNEWLGW